MFTKQVKFHCIDDDDDKVYGGILMDNKYVICGCHGGVFNIEDVVILQTYNDWMDLSESIIGE